MQVQPGKEVRDAHWGARDTSVQLKDIQKKLPLRVLSAADWQHWITKGYVIVRKAVPKDNVDRLVDLLWRFDEKDPNDPSTWYAPQRREHRLKELHALAGRRHGPLACIVLALDQPDLRRPGGIRSGDGLRPSELLAEALQATRRGSDVIARLGTAEFAIVAPESDVEGATALAERLILALKRVSAEHGAAAPPAVRAGLDGVPDFGATAVDPADLLRRANAALQSAVPGEGTWLRRFVH